MFRDHSVTHFTGPVSHPSSTGLLERAIQEIMSYVAKKCIEKGTREGWALSIRDGVLEMNTKLVRIHGYSPAQLMLGYEPQQYHFDIEPTPFPEDLMTPEEAPAHQCQIFTALRDENKLLAMEAASYSHYVKGKRDRKHRLPQAGDLVIVRHHTIDNQRGRKLEPKWLGPRLLTKITKHGLSGYVRELHGTGTVKRYHLNDILLYHQREPVISAEVHFITPTHGSTPVVTSTSRTASTGRGSRALVLCC